MPTHRPEALESRIAPAGFRTLTLPNLNGFNGYAVEAPGSIDSFSSIGDVNDDGIGDLAFSTIADNGGRGIVYVVYGRASAFPGVLQLNQLNGTNGFSVTGANAGDNLGSSIGAAGDLNGDGIADLAITAQGADGAGSNRGSVYVIYGRTGTVPATQSVTALNGSNGFTLTGGTNGGSFGFALADAGDLNGDGHSDFAIGEPNGSGGRGNVYVLFGKAGNFASSIASSAIVGSTGATFVGDFGEHLGGNVGGAGDVDGDGVADLSAGPDVSIITDPKVTIIFGDAAFGVGTIRQFSIGSKTPNGVAVGNGAFVSDVNNDGKKDLVFNYAFRGTNGHSYSGILGVFGTKNGFTSDPLLSTLKPKQYFGRFADLGTKNSGSSEFSSGDFNGDGNSDFLFNVGGTTEATLAFGGKKLTGFKTFGARGDTGFRFAGTATSLINDSSAGFAGDLNADGYDDVLVRVPEKSGGQKTYVVFGSSGRIASSGKSLTYKDWDGDLVTVSVSKGELDYSYLSFAPSLPGTKGAVLGGQHLAKLNLAAGGDQFEKASITVTVKKAKGGDGKADIGEIDATGLHLGAVKIAGGLGVITAGTVAEGKKPALGVASLSVAQLGHLGTDATWASPTTARSSVIISGLGSLNVTGDVDRASLEVRSGSKAGNIGSIKIRGDLKGGTLTGENGLHAQGNIGGIAIGGDVVGADVTHPVQITAGGTIAPAKQQATLAIKSFSVSGSVTNARLLAGFLPSGLAVNPDVSIGAVSVKKDWAASSISAGVSAGTNGFFADAGDAAIVPVAPYAHTAGVLSTIASIVIKGTVTGTATGVGSDTDHFGFTAQKIGAATFGKSKLGLLADAKDNLLVPGVADTSVREV